MGSEKYLNYYVEVLTNTMTDAVIRNISLQANARVTEEVITEQAKTIDGLKAEIEKYKTEKENFSKSQTDTINDLNNKLSDYNRMKAEYDNVKHQVTHVDTFRNELVKERESHQKTRDEYENKIKTLNEEIDYLKLTPAKRKKVDDLKNANVKINETVVDNKPNSVELNVTKAKIIKQTLPDTLVKDGGSF